MKAPVKAPGEPPGERSDRALLELAALALAQAAPDAEPLVVRECVLQALVADLAGEADTLRLPLGAALLREERLRIGLRAQGALLPAVLLALVTLEDVELSHVCPFDPATLTSRVSARVYRVIFVTRQ